MSISIGSAVVGTLSLIGFLADLEGLGFGIIPLNRNHVDVTYTTTVQDANIDILSPSQLQTSNPNDVSSTETSVSVPLLSTDVPDNATITLPDATEAQQPVYGWQNSTQEDIDSIRVWKILTERNLIFSDLIIVDSYLFAGLAFESPRAHDRKHGLYGIDLQSCPDNLELTTSVPNQPIYAMDYWGNLIVAASDGGILWVSINGGRTWESHSTETEFRIYTVSVNGNSTYIGVENSYVYTSPKDDLEFWTALGVDNGLVDINFIREINDTLWIGTYGSGIWSISLNENDDDYLRVKQHNSGLSDASLEIWDLIQGSTGDLYLATSAGLYYREQRRSWRFLGLENKKILSLALLDNELFLGTDIYGIWKLSLQNFQRNGEAQFVQLSENMTVREFLFDPIYCDGLLAATDKGLWLLSFP